MTAHSDWRRLTAPAVLAAAFSATLLAGCQPSDGDGAWADAGLDAAETHDRHAPRDDRPTDGDLVLSDNVHELSAQAADSMRVEANRLIIAREHAAALGGELDAIAPGDILVSDRGDGFWRHVLAVSRASDAVIFATRPAELTEVVESGEFSFEMQPFERRTNALNAPDEQHVGGVNLDANLTGDARANVSNGSLTINFAEGTLAFQPALKFQMSIENNTVVYETLRLSGFADLDATWQLSATTDTSYQQSFDVSPSNRDASFRLAGKRYYVEPTIRLQYDAVANQAGELRAGLDGDGYLLAGYECTPGGCQPLSSNGQDPFSAQPVYNWLGGEPRINFHAQLHAGVELRDANSRVGSAFPMALGFNSHTIVATPYCPFSQKSTLHSYASTEQQHMSAGAISLFDEESVVADIPQCAMGEDDEQDACVSDNDCTGDDVCTPLNVCGEDKPFYVALKWGHELDLDLYIETPRGDILSKHNRQVTQAELALISGGPSHIPGRCTGDATLNCENQAPQNGQCPALCSFRAGQPASVSGQACVGTYEAQCNTFGRSACPTDWGCEVLNGNCTGTYAASCLDLGLDESGCDAHPDCEWASGYCSGSVEFFCDRPTHGDIDDMRDDDVPYNQPRQICDSLFVPTTQIQCQSFAQSMCESFEALGCEWNEADQQVISQGTDDRCTGGSYECSDLGESTCDALSGCTWQPPQGTSPPSIEYAVFDTLDTADVYKIWVVNPNGAPRDMLSGLQNGRIPYSLLIEARDREAFQLEGEIEVDANARSVFFLYEVPAPSQVDDGACRAESDAQLCAQQGADCGRVSQITDSCGNEREIFCGSCPTRRCHQYDPVDGSCPYQCSYAYDEIDRPDGTTIVTNERCEGPDDQIQCQNNTCQCGDETDADLCTVYGYECGSATVVDSCGTQRTIDCGGCASGSCSPQNVCCEAPTDAELCADYEVTGTDAAGNDVLTNFACGSIQVTDQCGNLRQVDCSSNSCSSLDGTFVTESDYNVCTSNTTLQTRRKVADRVHHCNPSGTFCDYQIQNERTETLGSENCSAQNYVGQWSECDWENECDTDAEQWRWEGTYGCVEETDNTARCQLTNTQQAHRDCTRTVDPQQCPTSL